jgi:hypothetical protein
MMSEKRHRIEAALQTADTPEEIARVDPEDHEEVRDILATEEEMKALFHLAYGRNGWPLALAPMRHRDEGRQPAGRRMR